jgi:hypothetical protein
MDDDSDVLRALSPEEAVQQREELEAELAAMPEGERARILALSEVFEQAIREEAAKSGLSPKQYFRRLFTATVRAVRGGRSTGTAVPPMLNWAAPSPLGPSPVDSNHLRTPPDERGSGGTPTYVHPDPMPSSSHRHSVKSECARKLVPQHPGVRIPQVCECSSHLCLVRCDFGLGPGGRGFKFRRPIAQRQYS